MNLSNIEIIRLQSPERLLEHTHRDLLIATMGAYLSHQDDFVALAVKSIAYPFFTLAVMVIPAVVEKVDAIVDGFIDNPLGIVQIFRRSEGSTKG